MPSITQKIDYGLLKQRMYKRRMKNIHLAQYLIKPDGEAITPQQLGNWLNEGQVMPGYAIVAIAKLFDMTALEICGELLGLVFSEEDIPLDKAARRILNHITELAGGAA